MSLPPRPWEGLPATLAEPLARGVDATGEEIVAAVRAGVPAYARPLESGFEQGLRAGVAAALRQFVGLVAGAHDAEALDRSLYHELGRFEYREGRALESLLSAYRLGARVAWRGAAEAARDAGHDAEALALLAEAIFAYIDEMSAASAEGYAAEQSAGVHERERRRAVLLSLLTRRPPADPAAIEEAARAAGWPLPERLAALAWAGEGSPLLPPDALRGRVDDVAVALLPDPDAPGRAAELTAAFAGTSAALGPTGAWPDAGRSLRRARQALDLHADAQQLIRAEDHLAELVLHAEPGLTDELAARRLAPLHTLPGRSPDRLAETLRAWLDHHGSAPAVARELGVHPQTVRHRLKRLRELFGDALDDPAARFELALALRSTAATTATRATSAPSAAAAARPA
jgi:PucR-like helix-turn-helix protein